MDADAWVNGVSLHNKTDFEVITGVPEEKSIVDIISLIKFSKLRLNSLNYSFWVHSHAPMPCTKLPWIVKYLSTTPCVHRVPEARDTHHNHTSPKLYSYGWNSTHPESRNQSRY